MNYLWGGMIVIGVIYGAITGRLDAVTDQALSSAKEAVTLCITMAGVMAFWVGIMRIAERAGMVEQAARKLNPVMNFLFPSVPKASAARTYMATNMVANFLGLGWAATPAGLSAMKELKKLDALQSEAYVEAYLAYDKKLEELSEEIRKLSDETAGIPVVLFHEAFAYFADSLGMEVLAERALDEETVPSAGGIAEVIE